MANIDFNSLLNKQNFVAWMLSIASDDANPTIRQSAKEIGLEVNGNSIIGPKPYYAALYSKYKFKVAPIQTNDGIKTQLFELVGIKYISVGIIRDPSL